MLRWLDLVYDSSVRELLSLVGEPRPLDAPSGGAAYRLIRIPSFHPATVIRLDAGAGRWQITGKKLIWPRSRTETIPWSVQRVLRAREQREVERLLAELNIWELPESDGEHGLDGETWILEAKSGDRYHVIERWCPSLEALTALGAYLRVLARVPDDYRSRMGGEWRRQQLEQQRAAERDAARRQQEQLAKTGARNVLATALAEELERHGLTCPHCQRHARDIRYVHGSTDCEWYFVCRACGCSFTAREYEAPF